MFETTPKMLAENHFPDIIGINLEYALDAYDWEGFYPMTDNGITVTGFWDKSKGIPDTDEYELDDRGVYVRKRLDPQTRLPQLIVGEGWKTCGIAAEISATVSENGFNYLNAPIKRVTLPDCPALSSAELERAFYKYSSNIVEAVKQVMIQE